MTSDSPIELTLADIASQKVVNFSATAKKYGVCRETLLRRWKGKQGTRQET